QPTWSQYGAPPDRRVSVGQTQFPPGPPPHAGQVGREPQRPSPSSHRHGMYTTGTPSVLSQRREGPALAPSALNLDEPAAITYYPQRQPTTSQYWAPSNTGVSVGYINVPPPSVPPHTGLSPSSQMHTIAPPPLPPQRRESPAPAPSALNLNEPAAITYYPLQRQSTPTPSQYWALSDTGVSDVLPHPVSPPHTGQVGRGPQQPRLPPHRYWEYTTTTPPPPDGPWPRDCR
ncbi:hypothetical protein M378DRAFT_16677, partial [Amanita muscaria Koide BX008]